MNNFESNFDDDWTPEDEQASQIEEQFYLEDEKGSGGGGKRKKKSRESQGPKTRKAQRDAHVGASVEKRVGEAKQNLRKVLTNFPDMSAEKEDTYFRNYLTWLNESLKKDELTVEDEEFEKTEFSKPNVHAGGQNVNKSMSAARAIHSATNISVRNEDTRSGPKNENRAKKIIVEKLHSHLGDWEAYLNDAKRDITAEDLFEVMVD